MQFKVLVGSYGTPDKVYKRGETVKSDIDLIAKFGSECFERLGTFVDAVPVPPELEVEDVTGEFLEAAEADLKVTRIGAACAIYDDAGVMLEDNLTYDAVTDFVTQYLASEE